MRTKKKFLVEFSTRTNRNVRHRRRGVFRVDDQQIEPIVRRRANADHRVRTAPNDIADLRPIGWIRIFQDERLILADLLSGRDEHVAVVPQHRHDFVIVTGRYFDDADRHSGQSLLKRLVRAAR